MEEKIRGEGQEARRSALSLLLSVLLFCYSHLTVNGGRRLQSRGWMFVFRRVCWMLLFHLRGSRELFPADLLLRVLQQGEGAKSAKSSGVTQAL